MKRKIIAWCTVLAVVLGFTGLTFLLSGDEAVNYGMSSGDIAFTQADTDITELVIGSDSYIAAENENFSLLLDGQANPIILHKPTGRVWKSVPDNNTGNSKYSSALIISYFSDNSTKVTLYSSESSVDKNQVRVFTLKDGVKVEYGFGEMSADYVYPDVISRERLEKFLARMNEEDAEYILRRYRLYVLNEYEDEERAYLLNTYPRLRNEDLYILTNMSTNLMKKRTDEIFRSAGYTSEDRNLDNGNTTTERENPQTFRVSVSYTLTDNGFKAQVNSADCQYYSDYPLTEINILPYFDSIAGQDEGYFVIPSGCGALIKAGNEEDELELRLPVYGSNASLTERLEEMSEQCTLPVFGQYKNSGGYLCILGAGNQQAEISVDRNAAASAVSPSFNLIDTYSYAMSSSNPVQLFAADVADEIFCAEYVLFSDLQESSAYSEMAVYYRNRLIEEGVLSKKVHGEEALLLAEFVNVINYDTTALGFIPVNREYAVTTFNEAGKISEELCKLAGGENISVLLTGWNKKGINRQKLGALNFSEAAGGEKAYRTLLETLKENNIKSYLDINFTVTENFFGDGFSITSQAVRNINNSIVKLMLPDAQTNSYTESKFSLVSPKSYSKLYKSYISNEELSESGIGVSGLTSMLYGDYSDGDFFGRSYSLNEITGILNSIAKEDIAVLGDAGNLYALPYMDLINNLPAYSSEINAYYRDIPFVQIVLHGYVDYVTECVNSSGNIQRTVLKLIETGSGLHYILTANAFDRLFETDYSHIYNTNYDYLKEDIQLNYKMIREALNGLNNMAITEHVYLTDEVVRVKYENGAVIYVNYGDSDYISDGFTVPAVGYYRENN